MIMCNHLRPRPGMERFGLGPAADEYAAHGYAVLPLDRGGKRPHRMLGREGGVYNATTDSQQIVDWWLEDPAANIGIATGQPSALCVVDLDVKNGATGPANLMQWMCDRPQPLAFPDRTPGATTPSGGMHLWFRWAYEGWPAPERPGILPGVDIKGTGGLVVAPPSAQLITPAGRDAPSEPVPVSYRWDKGCPLCHIPLVPAWLADWAWNSKVTAGAAAPGDLLEADQVIASGAPVGERNRTYYRLACSLWRRYGPSGADLVRAGVEAAWRAGDTSGMDYREINVIIESARRFIAAHPDQLAAWAAKPENQFWRR